MQERLRLGAPDRVARVWRLFAAAAAALLGMVIPAIAWDEWPPLPPADLTLTDNQTRPGSSAMILLKTDYRNDRRGIRELFYRVKIFNDEGREHANVEIPYDKRAVRVLGIEARVVQPDGEIAEFGGAILEKTLAKTRKERLLAKTFTLPEIRPGSIIEYRYKLKLKKGYGFNSYWPLQESLFIRESRVSLKPAKLAMRAFSRNFPDGTELLEKGGVSSMTLRDLAPLSEEAHTIPPREQQARLHVLYGWAGKKDPATFWQEDVGEPWADITEKFMKKPRQLRSVVESVVSPEDSPEQKLRKLYDAVQKIRNLSYEEYYTKKERRQEDLDVRDWAGEVWDLGYGSDWEIARLFTALCRAAGFEAGIVFVSERDDHFFDRKLLDAGQLDGELTVVELPGGARYFDAGTRFAPFGYLGWENQGTAAMRVVNGRAEFVTTPASDSRDNWLQRDITLELSPDGAARATVIARYRGQSALDRRNEFFNLSDQQREHRIRSELEDALPDSHVTEISWRGLEDTSAPLELRYGIAIPGFAQVMDSRMLVTPALIAAHSALDSWQRESPVYLRHAYSETQQVRIVPPSGFELEFLPVPQDRTGAVGNYAFEMSQEGGAVVVRREFSVDGVIFRSGTPYAALKQHLDSVQAGDGLRLVFHRP